MYRELDHKVEASKREKNILTNNDLLYYAAELVREEYVAKKIAKNIKYLFVDECQDINYDQMRLFETLLNYLSLTIVGDEKQSIYAFRGSNKYAFNSLVEKMKNHKAEGVVSRINYRTNDELVKVFNDIFNSKFYFQRNRLEFNNIPLKGSGKHSRNSVFEIVVNKEISEIIKNLALNLPYQDKVCYTNIVVLCRTNKEVNSVVNQLKSKGIGVEIYSSKSIYKSKAVIDLYKVLKYLITNSEIDRHELFYTDYYLSALKYFNKDYLQSILFGFQFEIKKETINFVLNRLIEASKIFEYYDSIGKDQYIANINRLKEIFRTLLAQGLSNIQIVDYLNIMIETQQMEQEPETTISAPIVVSTIHTFKGLAADVVILYNADRNLYRLDNSLYRYDEKLNKLGFNKNSMVLSNYAIKDDKVYEETRFNQNKEYFEEELRLLYVACTRAKEKLIIACNHSESKIDYYIKTNPNYISYARWILESKI